MTRREAPEPWATAMRDRGLTHRDEPSMTRLAAEAGLGVQTVINLVMGLTRPTVETVAAVAEVLRNPKVWDWAGLRATEHEPWVPPAEANLLSRSERSALDALIRAVAERASETRDHTAPNTRVEIEDVGAGARGRRVRKGSPVRRKP